MTTPSRNGSSGIPATPRERDVMRRALELAARAPAEGGIPVGAVVIDPSGEIIAEAYNASSQSAELGHHAEMRALAAARATRSAQFPGLPMNLTLEGCTLVVTLEPCVMCAGAILASRVSHVRFGAWEPKTGAASSVYDILREGRLPHPIPSVSGGLLATESQELLADYFAAVRER